MGMSHLVFAPDQNNKNEGLMVDVDDGEMFEIGLGRWSTGAPSLGFNSAISGLTFNQFSQVVDKLIEIREMYKKTS